MSLFGKNPEAGKGRIPVKEVETLRRTGVSDKDIIKNLKSEGFSYAEIEKGMLQSLKQNISEDYSTSSEESWKRNEESPTFEDIYGNKNEAKEPSFEELMAPGIAESDISPELAIEELVEGVVNEKWELFEKELKKIRSDEEMLMRQIKQLETLSSSSGKDSRASVIERKISDIEDRMGDIDARISGIEKAFRQFLPSLTENIRSLSEMVRDMKSKTDPLESKAVGDEDLE